MSILPTQPKYAIADNHLQQFEAQYGPFDPPPDHQFEPEFSAAIPRPIPSPLTQGDYRRKQMAINVCIGGAVLLILSLLPIMRTWELYILPLAYLDWFAGLMLICSVVIWLQCYLHWGPFKYVRRGTPLVARITSLSLQPKLVMHGATVAYDYVAAIQYRDPDTKEIVLSTATREVPAIDKDRVALSYRVGEYVTAVYLGSNPRKTLRLYGFLGLRPDLGVIPADGKLNWPKLALIGAGAGGVAFLVGWMLYAFARYPTLEVPLLGCGLPGAIGAVVLNVIVFRRIAHSRQKEQRELEERSRVAAAAGTPIETPSQPDNSHSSRRHRAMSAAGVVLITSIFGAGMPISWALTINALCDSSPAVLRPIRIKGMWMTTHEFVFRTYRIDYTFDDDPAHEKHELLSTPYEMAAFGQAITGDAHVHKGLFGWPWVEKLTPRALNPWGNN